MLFPTATNVFPNDNAIPFCRLLSHIVLYIIVNRVSAGTSRSSSKLPVELKMQRRSQFKLVLWTSLTLAFLHVGWGAKCSNNIPTVKQTQIGFGDPPKFMVQVENNCPMCPVIDIHLKCGSFSQALVSPRLFKVLDYNNCVVNSGLPLGPLQKLSFYYSHQKYLMSPSTWHFQCE